MKISLLFKKFQIAQENNLRLILKIKKAKFSGYCFYMKTYRETFNSALVYLALTNNIYLLGIIF